MAFVKAIRMEADYEIKGKILVFPVTSRGQCTHVLGKDLVIKK